MEAWLRGSGCVPLNHLMEDAATAEISRAQVWQWIRHDVGVLEDGRPVTLDVVKTITDEEMERIRDRVGAESESFLAVANGQRSLSVNTVGVEPASFAIRGVRIAAGKPITRDDLDHRRRVAVLGVKTRERLMGGSRGVGEWIRINGTPYQVVGILDRGGTQLYRSGAELDEQIWIPLSSFLAANSAPWQHEESIGGIVARVTRRDLFAAAKAEIRGILSRRIGVSADDHEAIRIHSPIEMLERLPSGLLPGVLIAVSITTPRTVDRVSHRSSS